MRLLSTFDASRATMQTKLRCKRVSRIVRPSNRSVPNLPASFASLERRRASGTCDSSWPLLSRVHYDANSSRRQRNRSQNNANSQGGSLGVHYVSNRSKLVQRIEPPVTGSARRSLPKRRASRAVPTTRRDWGFPAPANRHGGRPEARSGHLTRSNR